MEVPIKHFNKKKIIHKEDYIKWKQDTSIGYITDRKQEEEGVEPWGDYMCSEVCPQRHTHTTTERVGRVHRWEGLSGLGGIYPANISLGSLFVSLAHWGGCLCDTL